MAILLNTAPRFYSFGGAATPPAALSSPVAGGLSDIIEARAREYLAAQAYHIAQKRHQRAARLHRAWIIAKARLAAMEARYG